MSYQPFRPTTEPMIQAMNKIAGGADTLDLLHERGTTVATVRAIRKRDLVTRTWDEAADAYRYTLTPFGERTFRAESTSLYA